MTNEFKKIKAGDVTRYVLENASAGGTSSGSIASVDTSLGGVRKRSDNILAQEAGKEDAPKPRNFVAKNAKMGGAGKMKDKNKVIPRKEKHKKPVAEQIKDKLSDLKDRLAVAEGHYVKPGSPTAYDRDYASSVSGMGKKDSLAYQQDGGANDEYPSDTGSNKPYQAPEDKPVLQGYYFYNVQPGQEQEAATYGIKQTKSGKWAKAKYSTSGRSFGMQKDMADKSFGPGKWWAPKQESVAEGDTPKDNNAPKQVQDRKTGKWYDPNKEFDKTMNKPEVKAQMKRMSQKEGSYDGTDLYSPEANQIGSHFIKEFGLTDYIDQQLAIEIVDNCLEGGLTDPKQIRKQVIKYLRQSGATIQRPKKSVAESNREYNDEAGMAHTNLHTIARAAQGLLDTIGDKENLPEWAQEKIAKVEDMLVVVWDYLKSQEEQGIDPQQDVSEVRDAYMNGLAEMLDLKLAEKIPKGADVDYYIKDFSKSNAPQFKGKTPAKRKQMAIAAYYGSKQKK